MERNPNYMCEDTIPKDYRFDKDLEILVVDDEAIITFDMAVLLSRNGYNPVKIMNGLDAVSYFSENVHKIGMVLMDIKMPIMSGLDAVKMMRYVEKENNLERRPIIAITGHESVETCIDAGFDGYMRKPYDRAYLIDYISRYDSY